MNVIEEKWRQMDVILARNGIAPAQRTIMAQAFYGGAYECAKHVAVGFDQAASPEAFAGVLSELMEELVRVREEGLPESVTAPNPGAGAGAGNGGGSIIVPGSFGS